MWDVDSQAWTRLTDDQEQGLKRACSSMLNKATHPGNGPANTVDQRFVLICETFPSSLGWLSTYCNSLQLSITN